MNGHVMPILVVLSRFVCGLFMAWALLAGIQLQAADTLVATGSVWKYLDNGVDQGTAWRDPNFNDSGWSNGVAQLGFGDGDERTPIRRIGTNGAVSITFYFRQTFYVTNKADYASLLME